MKTAVICGKEVNMTNDINKEELAEYKKQLQNARKQLKNQTAKPKESPLGNRKLTQRTHEIFTRLSHETKDAEHKNKKDEK